MSTQETQEKTGIQEKVREDFQIKVSKTYQIILHNNPYTLHNAVLDVLMTVFNKEISSAHSIMRIAEKGERALVEDGVSKDLAELKVEEARQYCLSKKDEVEQYDNGYYLRSDYDKLVFTVEEKPNE